MSDVKERHLFIDKTFQVLFERYYQDVTRSFTALSTQLNEKEENWNIKKLFGSYGFQSVISFRNIKDESEVMLKMQERLEDIFYVWFI